MENKWLFGWHLYAGLASIMLSPSLYNIFIAKIKVFLQQSSYSGDFHSLFRNNFHLNLLNGCFSSHLTC